MSQPSSIPSTAELRAECAKREELRAKYDKMLQELEDFADTEMGSEYKVVKTEPAKNTPDAMIKVDKTFDKEYGFFPRCVWLLLLYAILYYTLLQRSIGLLVPFVAIFFISMYADVNLRRYHRAQYLLDRFGCYSTPHSLGTDPQVLKAEHAVKIAGERLTQYKQEWRSARTETAKAYKASEELIKKFKNVSVPKVKGVTPKKSNSNSLTAPLERLVTTLKSSQVSTEKQLRLTAKILEMVEESGDTAVGKENMIKEAELALQAGDARGLQASGINDDVLGMGEKFEINLDEHYERLIAYFTNVKADSTADEVEAAA
ncbi:hypothetical protein FB567DRAFT_583698 [Paraphoma chrysanthemicola]|uniref:Uncharacterized protein n=1 Tax=Paraphoma chrysanthemicola TaxID=798071 RepID=A0A8K0QUZ7_9PLEO|nr:hypothetical protein FB567DRAFT_583698 [Paraphoma chrysanthemicola]